MCSDKAPLSKGLLMVLSGLTVLLTLLPQYHGLFAYNLEAIKQDQQVCVCVCAPHLSMTCVFL